MTARAANSSKHSPATTRIHRLPRGLHCFPHESSPEHPSQVGPRASGAHHPLSLHHGSRPQSPTPGGQDRRPAAVWRHLQRLKLGECVCNKRTSRQSPGNRVLKPLRSAPLAAPHRILTGTPFLHHGAAREAAWTPFSESSPLNNTAKGGPPWQERPPSSFYRLRNGGPRKERFAQGQAENPGKSLGWRPSSKTLFDKRSRSGFPKLQRLKNDCSPPSIRR